VAGDQEVQQAALVDRLVEAGYWLIALASVANSRASAERQRYRWRKP
jgi:hypothetical protein